MKADFLDQMAEHSRVRADQARNRADAIDAAAAKAPSAPVLDIEPGRFELIAEVKLRAPSVGQLAAPADPEAAAVAQATGYAAAGAAAISVLTEPKRFDGALSHLAACAQSVSTPLMRKDFLLDPIQIAEARVAGASGVLLITRMLSDDVLDAMLSAVSRAGLFVLVESFDQTDLARTAAALQRQSSADLTALVGVNTRDLATLQVDPDRLERCAPFLPPGFPAVAESGIRTPADAAHAASLGYQVALVGSALMQSGDPVDFAAQLIAAGRESFVAADS